MSYYADLTKEIAVLCFSVSLNAAEGFVDTVDTERLSQTEYVAVLAATAVRIGGCANYDPAGAFAAASRLTEKALSIYEPSNGDQTLDLMNLMTSYMRYPETSFQNGAAEQLQVFEAWIEAWALAERQIDPRWNPDEGFPSFDDPAVIDGQTPEGVADADARARYEEHLKKKDAFMRRHRDQFLLRRALEQYLPDFVAYAEELQKFPDTAERRAALADMVAAPELVAALRN